MDMACAGNVAVVFDFHNAYIIPMKSLWRALLGFPNKSLDA